MEPPAASISAFLTRPPGSGAGFRPSEGSAPAFVADVPGDYLIRSTVTDDTGRSSSVDTVIQVSN